MSTEEREAYRAATFRAATKGLSVWRVAKALNLLRHGRDWRGSTKGDMSAAFVNGDLSHLTGQQLRAAIAKAEGRS